MFDSDGVIRLAVTTMLGVCVIVCLLIAFMAMNNTRSQAEVNRILAKEPTIYLDGSEVDAETVDPTLYTYRYNVDENTLYLSTKPNRTFTPIIVPYVAH